MLNFLELVGILSTDPAQWLEKFEALKVLFYNAHSLVNEYRGHQARETLIMMMEAQVEEKRREVEDIKNLKDKIAGIMDTLRGDTQMVDGANGAVANGHASATFQAAEQRKRKQRAMWQALDEEMGT